MDLVGVALGALLLVLISSLWSLVVQLIWRPHAVANFFRKQGLSGPARRLFSGSLEELQSMQMAATSLILDNHCHDITTRVLCHISKCVQQYGETFVYWVRSEPTICITDMEMVKEVLVNKFHFYPKNKPSPGILSLLGKGLALAEGEEWTRHRRVVNPAFAMDKLKLLAETMAKCAKALVEAWHDQANQELGQQKEIEVAEQFQELSADVISRTAFGSSFKEGKEVFLAQKKLQILVAESFARSNFLGSRYLPTKRNLQEWKLEKIIRNKLMDIIQDRSDSKESSGYGNDLLGLMLEACQKEEDQMLSMDEIVDECKTFYFAGQETTAHLLTWATFLLSLYPDWQEKLRVEVLQECGREIPNADMLGKLKLVNMVLLETLRLYGPVVLISRRTAKDMTLGNIDIPKDTELAIPVAVIHRNEKLWGADANEFNPRRFENGISKAATHPNALLSFSLGPRVCIGQNFALLEAKVVLAMILQRFSFSLSPNYKHAPINVITLQPKFGLPIVLRPLPV